MKQNVKKALIPVFFLTGGLALGIYSTAAANICISKQQQQLAGERWGENTVQLSCFLSETDGLTPQEITSLRETLDAGTAQSTGITAWYDAYSCTGKEVQAYGTKRTAKNAELILVSEHYFRIHTGTLLSGNYLTDAGISAQLVFLEEEAAWNLFGSCDVAGMEIILENRICQVAGVAEFPGGEEDDLPGIYMLYSDYIAGAEAAPSVTCYEAVLPDPVEGYGRGVFTDAMEGLLSPTRFPEDEKTTRQYHIVQNTGRFSASGLWDYLRHITDYTVHTKAIAYPDFENAALRTLHHAAMLLLLKAAGFVMAGMALIGGCMLFRREIKREILRLMKYQKQLFHKKHIQEVIQNEKDTKNSIHPDSVRHAHDDALRMHAGK
ncbi:MAG: ABC transporter permease [Ruminococcus sp.]|nr:ABC transporter permease [Ruminococcus sp.]